MPIDLKIPSVGESIAEVQIAQWLKAEGDTVKVDESLAMIDTEKTTFELPAPESGKLVKILHPAGATVKVGEIVAQIEVNAAVEQAPAGPSEAEAQTKAKTGKPGAPATEPREGDKVKNEETAARDRKPPDQKVEAPKPPENDSAEGAPHTRARQEAQNRHEVPPSSISPSTDRVPPSANHTSGREEHAVPMSMLRRTMARRLVEAKQQMAMLTTFTEVDMSAVQSLRKAHQEAFTRRYEVKLGIMSLFVKATVEALRQYPQLNSQIEGDDIINRNYVDLGVAIASGRGLVAPILRNAEQMSIAAVEKAIGDFAARARDGALKPQELEGGTFTITNGGVFGSLFSTPIINPPQCAILGLHAIQDRPVAVRGEVLVRPMMFVALTYDHRIVDGREAVLFLRLIAESIADPVRLLIGI